ncbi:MAG TPA: hypothetical protein VMM82_00010 [Spirochaetia bacterium]|nr:hypothetical protein [Spirochaetia bacterium]
MKDFVREYGKIAGLTAAGAFLISLVVGLAATNPFGVALGRAILFALLFAGLAAGARYVFRKYLADLVSAQPPESATGQKIDITLPEEGPAPAQRAAAYARASAGPDAPPPTGGTESDAEDLAAAGLGEAAGLEESFEKTEQARGDFSDMPGDAFDDELPPLADTDLGAAGETPTDSVEEAESVPEDQSGAGGGEPGFEMDAELGRLPDISSLGGSPPAPRAVPKPRANESPEDAMKGALGGRDPATLARAIRTVLKREEKG